MGGAKAALMERHEIERWATSLLVHHGAASSDCPHDTVVDAEDPDSVEEAVEAARKSPYGDLTPDEAEAAVREAHEGLAVDCYSCARNAED